MQTETQDVSLGEKKMFYCVGGGTLAQLSRKVVVSSLNIYKNHLGMVLGNPLRVALLKQGRTR